MTFRRLSEYFQKLEQTSSRLKMMEILARLFREAGVKEMEKICWLALGRLGPKYEAVEFQLAEKMMVRVLAKAFGVGEKRVMGDLGEVGDLGDLGEKLKVESEKLKVETKNSPAKRDPAPQEKLSVLEVYQRLVEIAQEAGEGSVERKIGKMAKLLNSLDSLSLKYVVRIPLGKLRLGFSDMTIIDGLSYLLVGDKSLVEEIREVYEVRADVGWAAKRIREIGDIRGIRGVKPKVGVPVMPALCQRIGTVEEMMEKVGGKRDKRDKGDKGKEGGIVAVEPKFDGTRLQIHETRDTRHETRKKGVVIFTRNLENVTQMFPEIVEGIKGIKGVKGRKGGGLILDGEAIGVNPKTGKFLPFQETIKRKRKHRVQETLLEIPVVYFVFDVLFWEGKSWLARPFSERRRLLERVLGDKRGKGGKGEVIRITPQRLVDNPNDLRKVHDEYLAQGLEGAVVKNPGSAYVPGRRGFSWVKFKQEETKKGGGLADTIDCLVMGYYKGKGKRAKFGIGAFLVGIREGVKGLKGVKKGGFEGFVTVSKIGTGLTDEQWREMKVRGSRFEVRDKPKEYSVDKNLAPDVWVAPGIVVEIQADNITRSPIHTAGLALRFPRLKRFRDDKGPDEVTTVEEMEKLYQLQFEKQEKHVF